MWSLLSICNSIKTDAPRFPGTQSGGGNCRPWCQTPRCIVTSVHCGSWLLSRVFILFHPEIVLSVSSSNKRPSHWHNAFTLPILSRLFYAPSSCSEARCGLVRVWDWLWIKRKTTYFFVPQYILAPFIEIHIVAKTAQTRTFDKQPFHIHSLSFHWNKHVHFGAEWTLFISVFYV